VQGQKSWTHRRLALCRVSELDQQRPEDGFKEREDNRSNGGGAGQMALDGSGEGPRQQAENRDQREPACDAVRELDHGLDGRRWLQDSAVAERPMVAAACARAGGADQRAPEDDGDEVGKNAPRETAKSGGRNPLGVDRNSDGRHRR
jgi:hypothetical protein